MNARTRLCWARLAARFGFPSLLIGRDGRAGRDAWCGVVPWLGCEAANDPFTGPCAA